MCGIVGYIGPQSVVPVIIEGLRRLEYRGYDSAGIAVAGGPNGLELRRAPGKLRNLETVIHDSPIDGTFGIGHTRWATHGRPTEENAHPHRDGSGTLVVVHNGIVENYLALKKELIAKGHKFVSETDTEIIAHLIQDAFEGGRPQYIDGRPQSDSPYAGTDSANESEAVVTALNPDGSRPAMSLEEAVRRAVKRITGAFAIGVLSALEPNKLVAARMGPPAVIGIGDGEFFLASDVPGILHHTRNIHFLADGELAILTKEGVSLTDFQGAALPLKVQRITWDPIQAEKAGYKHFMLKEINEQPRAIRDTTLGRVSLDTGKVFLEAMQLTDDDLRNASQITIAACGTSWHAGLAGKFMIERLARLPVEVDYASEYRYRDPIADPRAIGLLITQSGETADTLAAQAELIAKGSKTLAICNVVGAAITRKAQGTLTTNAGPEIGVASTKAFTAQLTALFVLALHLAQVRGTISDEESLHLVTELSKLPGKLASLLNINSPDAPGSSEGVAAPTRLSQNAGHNKNVSFRPEAQSDLSGLTQNVSSRPERSGVEGPPHFATDRRSTTRQPLSAQCEELARLFHTSDDFLFLGRGIHYPIALEGALKLKEISYIHAEGYPAGEMKHGPNALIDESLPVVCIATKDPNDPSSVLKYEKTLSNIQEVTARSGRVIAIAIEGDTEISQLVEQTIYIPQAPELLLPILEVVPLQLLAYHIAVRRGCDVDQPRNLAKSVTVE
ncbi:glutamine--fructose-6-phosphate aminotransferase [Tunturibacter empetritectus]|uniref:Glutamine--fructose-6-phosphate aminotransferase [isomerizing] n=1 Tax=Tunturiibacter empetritectus TaxID=3069691 RepID=A0A7W8MRK8_9BACT|nr:glutamine--fructose-6-phosphate aminotransferase [Edaphobacter lichenicola]MBB5316915.1 glucosamine--fructose-6-phosphate aminotransferase (isomerizing) [Edaphobacter lichenicola]